eukprot:Nitzschia sp. Nitz4//scaffold3_size479765//334342//335387//NITZ4_000139-RA/size479765-processed-gene-1.314-mRNA-1//-1//CDS//3329550875//2415//frame0
MKPTTGQPRATATAMRHFFEWLEMSFGGNLPMDTGRAAEVMVRDSLQGEDLKRLFQHEATALHIPNFFPRDSAIELGAQLSKQVKEGQATNWKVSTAKGLESSDVFTLGAHMPYNVAVANQSLDEYYSHVEQELRERRVNAEENTAKQLWPLDKFRLELDQAWPCGAGLARDPKNPEKYRGGGLPRVMLGPTRWKRGFVHVDEMAPLSSANGFFSANVYLQLPDTTNSNTPQDILEIWPLGIRNRMDWFKNAKTLSAMSSQDAEGQMLLRKALQEPITIAVQPGDLILLCVQRPHAAVGFSHAGTRVSLQCFLQYSGLDNRLHIES